MKRHISLGIAGLMAACIAGIGTAALGAATGGDEIAFRSINDTTHVIHSYTTVGDSAFTPPAGVSTVDYLVIGGGGGGGHPDTGGTNRNSGGGGGGGMLEGTVNDVDPISHIITVGGGGEPGESGGGSSALGIAVQGGGHGGQGLVAGGSNGGSGGGSGHDSTSELAGTGVPNQGHEGGPQSGGGAGGPGGNRTGGPGRASEITGTSIMYAGGGSSRGEAAGHGAGTGASPGGDPAATPGSDGLGGGGGAGIRTGGVPHPGAAGGSGIVILRHAWNPAVTYAVSGEKHRVLVEDAVSLIVAEGDTLQIREGGQLNLDAAASLTVDGVLDFAAQSEAQIDGALTIADGGAIGGGGTITGDLTLEEGAHLVFTGLTLSVTGTVSLDSTFGVHSILGLDGNTAIGDFILFDDTLTDFSLLGIQHWGEVNAEPIGGGKSAYFESGSLKLVVIPEPHTLGLLLAAGALLAMRRRVKQ